MAGRVRDFDWSRTPLGPMDRWPQSLRTAVGTVLSAPVPMALWWGRDLTLVYNDGYAPFFGARHPDALGRSGRDVWSAAWPKIGPFVEAVMERGESVSRERDHFVLERHGSPEDAWFTWSYSPVPDDAGGVGGLLNIAHEDTAAVRAEAARRAGEDRLRALVTTSGSVLYQVNADWTEVQPLDGKGLIPSTDRPDRDWMNRNLPASEHAAVRERINHCIATKTPFEMEHRVNRPDGSVGWTRSRAVPVIDGAGEILEWVGTAEDITDRQRWVATLAETRRKLNAALIAGEVGTFEWDVTNDRLWGDRNFEHIFGLELDASGAAPLAAYVAAIHPADRDDVLERVNRSVETGCDYEAEYRVTSAIPPRWVVARGKVERDGDGGTVRFPGVVLDQTRRKQAELLLAAQNRALELVASGAPLAEALGALTQAVEVQYDGGAVAAILLVNEDGCTLRTGAAPGLPADYIAAIDGIKATPGLGTCADAAARNEIVVTPDIAAAPSWCGLSHLPLGLGLKAAWSMPIRASDGRVVGTFGTYFRERREPTDREREVVEGLCRVAALAIDRRRAEERLRTSEERLALSIGAGELGTFYCPMPLGRIEWNDTCKAHFWLPPDAEIDFDLFFSIIHPDDRERTRQAVDRAVFSREPYDIEYRTVAPDGRQRWVRAKGRAYYDAAGNPVRFDGVTLDVTDRRQAADALRDSERRFREMADTAPAMLWVTEPDGYCSFLSRGWYEFTGQTEEQGLGFGWTTAAHPDDQEAAKGAFVAASRDRMYYEVDFRLRRADGEYRWVIDAGRPRFGPNGEFFGFIGSVIDIDDRKHAEAERNRLLDGERAARFEAERASRMKDEFLATLSHELRTPLNAILGWSQILAGGTKDAADLSEGLRTIERNARAQTQIIEDLLDMSRIISGRVRLDVQRVDLGELVRLAVETAKPSAAAKGIRLQPVLDPHAGPVSGDPNRLQQVLWNLLSNAMKFTPKGGRVQVLLERVNSHVEVRVTDTGEGIAPEFLPHVFDRFRQGDATTTRRHGGLGLGLSIVKQLVELHGGSVRADSPGTGHGATFTVTLPLTAVQQEPEPPLERRHPRGSPSPVSLPDNCAEIAGVKVLVVDDEPDARALMKRLLEDCLAEVVTAGSAAEAVDRMRVERPHVLVSDVGMPVEDGYALIRRVRELGTEGGGRVPAIALTAYARAEDRVKAITAGFDMHLAKPVEPAELVAMVASLAARQTS